jgi:hypothetical protein
MNHVSDENFILYAARHYDNPFCATEKEFHDDLSRIKFIQKMFRRYDNDKTLNIRLILNHLRLLYNVFDHEHLTRMLVFRFRNHLHYLKPFLLLLGYWPEQITNVGAPNMNIKGSDIPMDTRIVQALRGI